MTSEKNRERQPLKRACLSQDSAQNVKPNSAVKLRGVT